MNSMLKNKSGLIVVVDWTDKIANEYKGFDGETIWPYTELRPDGFSFLKQGNINTYSSLLKFNSHSLLVENGLISINNLSEVLSYQSGLERESRLLYIRLSNLSALPSTEVQKNFTFAGYDYGNYVWEENYYSLVYHEIICGPRKEFKNYLKYLNKNLLFSSLDQISALEKTKNELKTKGEHLEDELEGEEFQPIGVYTYNELN